MWKLLIHSFRRNSLRKIVIVAAVSMWLDILLHLESGDSTVLTRWNVDQEAVDSNPTHGRN